ncbi:hypothetical protein ACQ4PT_038204 [Festuca glaucescens]
MAHPHQGEEDRRPPPLGLRGLSRVAFQSRSPAPGGLPPLGLAGRGPLPSFSIGTAAFERVAAGPSTFPRRRVGLPRPSRPPAPNEAGSSNWATSIGGGSGSAGSARSSFVGFSLANGSGGISFGGGGGISFGGGGSESLGFTFSTGTGGNRREGSSHGGSTEGIGGNEGTIGYRGVGYNPNFDHADEYPPSQEHVQTQKEPLDLNVMSNKETRTQYRTDEKRHIYSEILARNGRGNRLKHGVSKAVALACECPRRIVQRVWQQAKNGGGITGVKNNRKLKSGRKKINLNIDALEAIPPRERTTLEQVAGHLNMSTTTVWRRLKMKEIRRITSELKPALTDANQRARLEYALMHLERCSITALGGINPTFRADMDVVHIDEKWFYRTRKTQNMYLSHREEAPNRECKNKNHIQKIMFLSAMARPRYDAQGNCVFDGKIGVWAYTEWVQAKKRSQNRLRGAWELKPADKVDREKSREYLVKYVLPAIKEKWPESDRWNTIYIQQDNAKTHIKPDDPLFLQEAARGGWDIRMIYQPPNSPDTNILDLGWFASIQAMFHRKMPKTLPEIVQKVNQSLAEYPHQRLNRIWLSHQACMREIIKRKGSIHYAVPHLKKKALERQGLLPVRLTIDREYVEQAIEYLNST